MQNAAYRRRSGLPGDGVRAFVSKHASILVALVLSCTVGAAVNLQAADHSVRRRISANIGAASDHLPDSRAAVTATQPLNPSSNRGAYRRHTNEVSDKSLSRPSDCRATAAAQKSTTLIGCLAALRAIVLVALACTTTLTAIKRQGGFSPPRSRRSVRRFPSTSGTLGTDVSHSDDRPTS